MPAKIPTSRKEREKWGTRHAEWLNSGIRLFRNVLDETFGVKVISRSVGFRNHERTTYKRDVFAIKENGD